MSDVEQGRRELQIIRNHPEHVEVVAIPEHQLLRLGSLLHRGHCIAQTGRSLVSLQKLEYGRMIYRAYLARYAECLSTGIWPDYNAHKGNLAGWSLDEGSRWDEMEAQAAVESMLPELDEEETPEEEGENIP